MLPFPDPLLGVDPTMPVLKPVEVLGFNPYQYFGVDGSLELGNYYDAAASLVMRQNQPTFANDMQYL